MLALFFCGVAGGLPAVEGGLSSPSSDPPVGGGVCGLLVNGLMLLNGGMQEMVWRLRLWNEVVGVKQRKWATTAIYIPIGRVKVK